LLAGGGEVFSKKLCYFSKSIANFPAASAVFPAARLVIQTSTGGISPIRPFFADFPLDRLTPPPELVLSRLR